MNRMDAARRAQVVRCLVEGCSINSTVRMTGAAKHTILKLLVELGNACAEYIDKTLVNLPSKRIQCDEIWSFVGCKEKNVTLEKIQRDGVVGDVWTWIAIDADTKLICSWLVGGRDAETARDFIFDLSERLANRVQLTSDGHHVYLSAVDYVFQGQIDYAMLVKLYGQSAESETRYSPATCIGCESKRMRGNPDPRYISTSYVERQNLTMRMQMRRFTRLTNAFSKRFANHIPSLALYVMAYNFCRKHQTLGTTPAVKAGLTDHIWGVEEIIALLEERESRVA
jgi:IS1 family transposase